MNFEIVQNDITNMCVDAIVLPANEQLLEGSGTSNAIFKKAGRKELTKACQEIGYCKLGDAVPTRGFKLDANYIIHAVVPRWIDGAHQEYEYLSSAYLAALSVADVMECESIAFPLLAAGNNGFELGLAYDIAKESIKSFEGEHLKQVFLVLYGDNIAVFARGRGDTVTALEGLKIEEKKEQSIKAKQRRAEIKELAKHVAEEQISKAIEYLKDAENRKKVIETGTEIVKFVVAIAKKK